MSTLEEKLMVVQGEKEEIEKEQDDLLVLLEDLSTRRKSDKARMRDAQLEVSSDDDDDDE